MSKEKQTWYWSVPWNYTVDEETGQRTLWHLNVEVELTPQFKCLYDILKNFNEVWNRSPEEALNHDYVVSVRPCSKYMIVDEKMLALPKFVNEPWPKNRDKYENEQTATNS